MSQLVTHGQSREAKSQTAGGKHRFDRDTIRILKGS
jgi:hypothetical protein